jgi:hypothetical protein
MKGGSIASKRQKNKKEGGEAYQSISSVDGLMNSDSKKSVDLNKSKLDDPLKDIIIEDDEILYQSDFESDGE